MVAPGSQWPPLSGGRENSARNINERILDANYDVRQLLNHISSNNSVKVPRPVLEYLKSIQELTTDLIKNPIGQDWKQQFEQLRQETSQIKQDIHAVRIASSNVSAPNRIRSYVDAVKNAPPPTHFLSSHGSASTNPATPSDLLQDRQVIVKLGDSDGTKVFRTRTPAEITKLAEKARVKAAKATYGITVASAKFVAARQLKSGDISLSLRTAKEAEIMRCHRECWVKYLWKGSEVRLPSWGVVIHDVNVRSLGINTAAGIGEQGRKQGIIKQLLTENLFNWGDNAEITQISWLVLPEGKKSGSLIVEFTSPHTANNAIDTGTLWDSEVLTTVLYDRAARIRQCHNCQKYGHIGNTCSNETRCVFCAEKHHSRDCQRKKDATLSERKCANCGGAHNGWSKRCPDFIREIERVQTLAQTRERHHRVPAYLSMAAEGTQAAITEGSGSSGGSGPGTSTKESSRNGRQSLTKASNSTPSSGQPASSNKGPASEDTEMQEAQEPQPEDTPATAAFIVGDTEASAIGEAIRQSAQRPARGVDRSIHTPVETRSEPPRRRAPSRASTSSSTATRSKGLIRSVLDTGKVQKRARDEAYVLEDEEAELPGTPSSSAPATSASEYQPSVLSRTSGNRRISTGKHRATGKENAIFKNNASAHTPGPRGKNKRTLDDQVNLTMSALSVKSTNRAGIQEERRTRQFTKKQTEITSNE
ncbi:hypothetical protein PENFLA_c128G07575 [Penicillium flavigenum]|uniref:CCHC-type domain-containing protein n=1 Tax=Penicillium flavigenum TaxID=254877 RepID=A0A1V6S4D0_9EURO|nr:hypothetical protein PENFLA_c128G07575 [Penicillium flavigenum]